MKKQYNILLVKETKSGEKRVALVPDDVSKITNQGHKVFIEDNAGVNASFTNEEYIKAGGIIKTIDFDISNTISAYKNLFNDIDIIVRAKRPDIKREKIENQAINPNTIMIGALDPLERNSTHIEEYHKAGIKAYSIDQITPTLDAPSLLTSMSKIAGKLSVIDAINKSTIKPNKIVIIGFGVVGQSALKEAKNHNLDITVISGKTIDDNVNSVIINSNSDISTQQDIVKKEVIDADIVITSARKNNQLAPILISNKTLKVMKKNSVIVDMAISEGGNVEGSEHDKTVTLGNQIKVTNTSGYPKKVPHEASILWSETTLDFILKLINKQPLGINYC